MKTPSEMFIAMLPNLLKGMGFEPEAVMTEFKKLRGTVGIIAAAAVATFNGVCMANRRLARLEAHFGLSDIEPVPEPMKGITHDATSHDGHGSVLALDAASAR